MVDGRAGDLGVEKEGGALNLLADEETNEGEHGDTAVGQLSLTEATDLVVIGALEEVEGVYGREVEERGKELELAGLCKGVPLERQVRCPT